MTARNSVKVPVRTKFLGTAELEPDNRERRHPTNQFSHSADTFSPNMEHLSLKGEVTVAAIGIWPLYCQ